MRCDGDANGLLPTPTELPASSPRELLVMTSHTFTAGGKGPFHSLVPPVWASVIRIMLTTRLFNESLLSALKVRN